MKISFYFSLLFFTGHLFSQTIEELKIQKEENLLKLGITKTLLSETKTKKEKTINDLLLKNQQIDLRTSLIKNIDNEINYLNNEIDSIDKHIYFLERELAIYKKEYAEIIKDSYKNRDANNVLMFLFASKSFNQAYKRIKYFQQYSNYRNSQKELILNTQKELIANKIYIDSIIDAKSLLKNSKIIENKNLLNEINDQRNYLNELKSKESKLRKEFYEQTKISEALQKAISKLISKEFEKDDKGKAIYELTPEQLIISNDFINNKGKLPWPAIQGIIIKQFGEHRHPIFKYVTTINKGIDIAVPKNTYARAIFNGEVKSVLNIPGAHKAVLIRHGEYLTVYSNLSTVNVKIGDKISIKDNIGIIHFNTNESNSILHFELWHENQNLNPSDWISFN